MFTGANNEDRPRRIVAFYEGCRASKGLSATNKWFSKGLLLWSLEPSKTNNRTQGTKVSQLVSKTLINGFTSYQ